MADDVKTDDKQTDSGKQSDNGKLSLEDFKAQITRDVNDYENYFNSTFAAKVSYLQDRYEGIRERDPNLPAWCSNMTYNRAFGLVHSEAGQAMPGIYQPNQFFTINADDKKSEMGVKALQKLMYKQIPDMQFYSQHYWGIMDSLYMPAGWMKWGWVYGEKGRKVYGVKDGNVETKTKRKKVSMATCQSIDIKDIIFDWKGYGVDDMRYAGNKYYISVEDIRKDTKKYNEKDEVTEFLKVIDKMPIETRLTRVLVHEIWYHDEVGIVTENSFCLCRQDNTAGGRLPYRPLVKFPTARSVMGVGSIEAGAELLDAQDDLLNATFDGILLAVHKPVLVEGNLDNTDTTIWPGKQIKVKPNTKVSEIFKSPMGNDWLNIGQNMDASLNRVLGNIDQMEDKGIDTATQARFVQARSNTGRRTYIDYNRENYLKWALEFWAEMCVDNMTEAEIIEVIGEKEAEKLNLIKDQLKLKELNYTITITGDNDLEDRMSYIQNTQTFLGILGQIAQLKQVPGTPINFDLLTQSLVNKFNFPDGVYVEPQQQSAGQGDIPTIEQEIQTVAQSRGVTPEQLIAELSQQSGTAPEQVAADIQAAGSFSGYLKNMKQQEAAI